MVEYVKVFNYESIKRCESKGLAEIGVVSKPRRTRSNGGLHIAHSVLNCPEEELACRILERAITDYQILKTAGVESTVNKGCVVDVVEVKSFFCSDWCNWLLEFIDSKLSGSDIMARIDKLISEEEAV